MMALGHDSGVRLETGTDFKGSPHLHQIGNMKPIQNRILAILLKKHFNLSLHSLNTADIKPIAKIDVSVDSQRHCSTTFYQ